MNGKIKRKDNDPDDGKEIWELLDMSEEEYYRQEDEELNKGIASVIRSFKKQRKKK